VLEQRIGRIHRLGQKRPIDVFNLVSRACIEERIAGLVADKRALFKSLFDGTTDELKFEGSGAFREVLARLSGPAIAEAVPATDDDDRQADDVEVIAEQAAAPAPAPAPAPSLVATTSTLQAPGSVGEGADADVARLFEALSVQRSADGGVRIEAPPHAAKALVSLLGGLARLLGGLGGLSDSGAEAPPSSENGRPATTPDA
jgi:hypothetical protein